MVDTHVYVPEDLLEWAKMQDEGFAPMVRRLLRHERELRHPYREAVSPYTPPPH
jgi:hypothetical protein